MSIETWKEEFYPIPANRISVGLLVKQSILKWNGLLKENLEKHECVFDDDQKWVIKDQLGKSFIFNGSTCPLCHYHVSCVTCSIVRMLGHDCGWEDGPYAYFLDSGDPIRMISVLTEIYNIEESKKSVKEIKKDEQKDLA